MLRIKSELMMFHARNQKFELKRSILQKLWMIQSLFPTSVFRIPNSCLRLPTFLVLILIFASWILCAQNEHFSMTPRERILAVYRGETPDVVPFMLDLSHWFYHKHQMPVDLLLADLGTAVGQLPYQTRSREAEIVANVLHQRASRRRGVPAIGELLPAILARLGVTTTEDENGDRP